MASCLIKLHNDLFHFCEFGRHCSNLKEKILFNIDNKQKLIYSYFFEEDINLFPTLSIPLSFLLQTGISKIFPLKFDFGLGLAMAQKTMYIWSWNS